MGSYLWVCDLLDLETSWIRPAHAFSTARRAAVLEGADEYELELACDLLSA